MLLQFKFILLTPIFPLVLSNYEEFDMDSIAIDESCKTPDETMLESNCYCYSQPEMDFEYSICATTNDTTTTTIPFICPLDEPYPQFGQYQLVQGKCFYFEKVKKNFTEAMANCKQKGGKLYEPINVVQMKKVSKIGAIGGGHLTWIGITDIAMEGNYVYDSNGKSINFSPPWITGYGAHGTIFNCIAVYVNGNADIGKLYDYACYVKHYSICEF